MPTFRLIHAEHWLIRLKRFLSKKESENPTERKTSLDVERLFNLIQENPDLKKTLLAGILADESTKV